jgi:hypothetical protein
MSVAKDYFANKHVALTRHEKNPMIRRLIIMATLATAAFSGAGEVKIAVAGSSAAQGYDNTDGRLIFGRGEMIQDFFTGATVENFALGGYSTKMFIERGNWQKRLGSKPDFTLRKRGSH